TIARTRRAGNWSLPRTAGGSARPPPRRGCWPAAHCWSLACFPTAAPTAVAVRPQVPVVLRVKASWLARFPLLACPRADQFPAMAKLFRPPSELLVPDVHLRD